MKERNHKRKDSSNSDLKALRDDDENMDVSIALIECCFSQVGL